MAQKKNPILEQMDSLLYNDGKSQNSSGKTPEKHINLAVEELSANETIKIKSNYLRGTLVEGLKDPITGSISEDDAQLVKFHGSYIQYDRDLDKERRRQKLEPLYSFLIRIRVAGGVATADQWLSMDRLADTYANGTLKLTTRQAFQLHGVLKRNLKKTVKQINDTLLDTIAACGDVNRNVMCTVNPFESAAHEQAQELARQLNDHLTPQTTAYHEIWLDKKLVVDGRKKEDYEPIYGKTYLPRKFKIAIAIPPINDTDVFANDLGYIAIEEDGKLIGYNVTIGGGLGTTFGNITTYPRLANVIGFCTPEQAVDVGEKVVLVQRDYGNRKERKNARLKYTIDNYGLDWFTQEVEQRLGYKLAEAKPYNFERNGDKYGWAKGTNGKWFVTLFIEGGRVKDFHDYKLKTGLKEVAKIHDGNFMLTGNQNLIVGNITEEKKAAIEKILTDYKILSNYKKSGLRLNSIACVSLNTCSLAFAEAERYLPSLIDKLDLVFAAKGLSGDEVTIRMTGCPNGCGRPYLAEIGFIGKSLGRYNLYLGGGFNGKRLNNLYKELLNEDEIMAELTPIIERYAKERENGERFGDFVIRKGYISEIIEGKEFAH